MSVHVTRIRGLNCIRKLLAIQRSFLSDKSLDLNPETHIPRKVYQDMVREKQTFKKGEVCDSISIYVRGGAGGTGVPSRNGIGGQGGSVWMEAMTLYQNLNHIHHHHNRGYVGGAGDNATHSMIHGKRGEDTVVEVPLGTVATDLQTGKVLCDVDMENHRYLLQDGSRGGSLINNYRGLRGGERFIKLVLKSIADVGLVGYPNAGKSSLLSMLSNATPTIGSYPFTTLKPTVGHIQSHDRKQDVKIADIPGLIEGASENRGLGHVFLRHIERTKILLFVIDVQGFQLHFKEPHRSPFETFGYLCRELELYMPGLSKRPIVVAVNKMDAEDSDEQFDEFVELYKTKFSQLVRVHSIVPVSCYTGQGLDQLQELLFEMKYKKSKKLRERDIV